MLGLPVLDHVLVWLALLALLAGCAEAYGLGRLHVPPMGPYRAPSAAAVVAGAGAGEHGVSDAPAPSPSEDQDLIKRCKLLWRNATLDHFTWAKPEAGQGTFRQRYYVCDKFFRPAVGDKPPGPIFFYVGNEADVTLYLNHTGLMWESAPAFGALLVFAEHRYYGQSKPFHSTEDLKAHMGYLTAEQAMGDYAELITELREAHNLHAAPVIAFGGSYGGMLASWMRMKYPHIIEGALAASAPIWNFLGEEPAFDAGSFAEGVTYDASPAGGSPAACAPNVRRAWQLCEGVVLNSTTLYGLRDWLSNAWDYMAMGNFPYPSSYMLNGNGKLPAYPVRKACAHLAEPLEDDAALIAGMAQAAGVFYNYSGTLTCFDFNSGANPETDEDSDFWGYQWCTEMFMPFSRNGVDDMFWVDEFNATAAVEGCKSGWGTTPRPLWATIQWGGRNIRAASNILFTNGLLDPWHGGGVLEDINDSVLAIIIPEGAHHLDLMFARPGEDPPSVVRAREIQRAHMRRWVAQARARTMRSQHAGRGGQPLQGVQSIIQA